MIAKLFVSDWQTNRHTDKAAYWNSIANDRKSLGTRQAPKAYSHEKIYLIRTLPTLQISTSTSIKLSGLGFEGKNIENYYALSKSLILDIFGYPITILFFFVAN